MCFGIGTCRYELWARIVIYKEDFLGGALMFRVKVQYTTEALWTGIVSYASQEWGTAQDTVKDNEAVYLVHQVGDCEGNTIEKCFNGELMCFGNVGLACFQFVGLVGVHDDRINVVFRLESVQGLYEFFHMGAEEVVVVHGKGESFIDFGDVFICEGGDVAKVGKKAEDEAVGAGRLVIIQDDGFQRRFLRCSNAKGDFFRRHLLCRFFFLDGFQWGTHHWVYELKCFSLFFYFYGIYLIN